MCCLNMCLNLKILKMSPALFARRYILKALQTRLIISLMLLYTKNQDPNVLFEHVFELENT